VESFAFNSFNSRTIFGAGSHQRVRSEIEGLGARRVMLVHGGAATEAADAIAAQLDDRLALRWSRVAQHVPVPLAQDAREAADNAAIDAIVCVGGGSAIGLGKAIALTHGVPLLAVPTTYSGSEQTAIYGLTGDHHKETGDDPRVRPQVVLYDPGLTLGLPIEISVPSAFNALAHSIEALWAPGSNPFASSVAIESVRHIHASLPAVRARPSDPEARSQLLLGAAMAGMALGWTATGLHHKICHVLGGMFDLTHADTHSVVLPHVLAFNAPAIPGTMARLASALEVPPGSEAEALWDLAIVTGAPTRLADLKSSQGSLTSADLSEVAAAVDPGVNPRPVTSADVLRLLEAAFVGSRPSSSVYPLPDRQVSP
jgi:maleylacetate reductase